MDNNLHLLQLKKSKIRNAGTGCFAQTMIPSGTILGPYNGKYMTWKERQNVDNGMYIWRINDDRYVDAREYTTNNPLRYVNGAKTKQQQKKINCVVKMIGKDSSCEKVYYLTTRDILPNEELLISYGSTYFTFPH